LPRIGRFTGRRSPVAALLRLHPTPSGRRPVRSSSVDELDVPVVDAQRLKDSFARVAGYGDELPLFFYSYLFLTYPDTREMFPVSMASQRGKLAHALGQIVADVDNLDDLLPFLHQLASDHRKFGVVAKHHPAVRESLLATLEHFLGADWTPQLARDWEVAYDTVAAAMVEAAERAERTSPPWWDATVVSHERRSLDVAVLRLQPDSRLHYLPGQSVAVETPLRPRLWRYYSPANAPAPDGTIELHVRLVDGGQVSAVLVQSVTPGDVLRLGAPVGHRLTLDPAARRDLLLIAGGTGLAPLRALVEQVGSGPSPRRTHLFVGARTEAELYDQPALTRMARAWPWLTVYPVVSEDGRYLGERGLVVDAALRHGPWDGQDVYVCGSPAMVAATVDRLTGAGIHHSRIQYEDFGRNAGGDRA